MSESETRKKIPIEQFDADALKVVERLRQFDQQAYFVGGCVRDLLVGLKPKDFDLATSATPRQIKRFFRNCRIIGRRFKLAHIVFGKKIIETATFRKNPTESSDSPTNEETNDGVDSNENETQDLLIREDNIFGTAEEDARRRDFTINALFYDPATQEVIDYVGGTQDLENKWIRTIGDPWVRFREDPVRILRAVKFATRLNFQIEPEAFLAMKEISPDLIRSAPPRILEEILRLLRSGHAKRSFEMLREVGALKVILPEIEEYLVDEESLGDEGRERVERFWKFLEILDSQVIQGQTPTTALGLCCLFYPLFRKEHYKAQGQRYDLTLVAASVIGPLARRTRLPRFDCGRIQRICVVQQRFTQRGGRRFRPNHFVQQDYFPEALRLFQIYSLATGMDPQIYQDWAQRQQGQRGQKNLASHAAIKYPVRSKQQEPSHPTVEPEEALLREEERDPSWGDW